MDADVKDAVRWATAESDAERATFPEVVQKLMAAGVERYHADLVCSAKTYYLPNGEYEVTPCHKVAAAATDFDPKAVEAALRAIQGQSIKYREFCDRIAAAGCVGYFVSFAGRRAVYYGRTGETYVEWFPGAK